jgi:CheY-like chemotaxis protein
LSAGAPLRDTVAQIHKAGERAAGLTRQLLAFSRKQVLEPRVLDLNRVVKEMRPMLERLVGEDVKVRAALHAESGTVSADPHQLEQVLMNLAANARDAMPGGGELVIETAQVERHVMLAVSDNGVGMDEATRRQIFEPFFTTKEVGKGTGLGLSMVQGIVAQSGGYIVVHSEPGQGTSFKIYLPALAGAAGPADVPAQREAERPARILVADDEPGVRSFLRKALEADGNEVIEAADGKQALEEALARQVDLVITDLVMPEQEGIETVRALRQDMPGVGIIAISGAFDGQFLKTAQMLGADAVLAKPVSAELLLAKVSEVLKWRR